MKELAESVAHAFVRAINRGDVAALTALMTDEHRFVDSLGNVVQGRDVMRTGWIGYFKMVPDYAIAVEETYSDGPTVVMLGLAQGTYAPDGMLSVANHWEIPVALRALVEDGRVVEWRVYCDNEPMRQRMAQNA